MFGIFRPHPAFAGIGFIMAVFIEIASIIIVGRQIGVFPTLALLFIAVITGVFLLRLQGANFMATMQRSLAAGRMPTDAMADNAILMFAAILFIIPGFISDITALLLLIPQVRTGIRRLFNQRFKTSATYEKTSENNDHTIDLDAEDYHSIHPEDSPWRKDDKTLPPKE